MAEERKYRIRVDGILVDVSKEVYRAYYSTASLGSTQNCSLTMLGAGNPAQLQM